MQVVLLLLWALQYRYREPSIHHKAAMSLQHVFCLFERSAWLQDWLCLCIHGAGANTAHLALVVGRGCLRLAFVCEVIDPPSLSALCLLLCEREELVVEGAL